MARAGQIRMTPTFLHILLSLVEGDRHGYRMMQEIKTRSGGTLGLGPSTLYWALGRLEGAGLIAEAGEQLAADSDDERRRYWRITTKGHRALHDEMAALADLVARAQSLRVIQ